MVSTKGPAGAIRLGWLAYVSFLWNNVHACPLTDESKFVPGKQERMLPTLSTAVPGSPGKCGSFRDWTTHVYASVLVRFCACFELLGSPVYTRIRSRYTGNEVVGPQESRYRGFAQVAKQRMRTRGSLKTKREHWTNLAARATLTTEAVTPSPRRSLHLRTSPPVPCNDARQDRRN